MSQNIQWSTLEKIAFRFIFLLFISFVIFFNNGTFPPLHLVMKYVVGWLHVFIPWLAQHILHLPDPITVFTNGSGDTTYDYVMLLFITCTSLAGTALWSVADHRRIDYNKLYYWLTVVVRLYVGIMLMEYGLVKVIKMQFPFPSLYKLTATYGESSPMGLAWTFLGFSKGYNIFMGIAELMALLLLFRRTVTFGAIIALMTSANIMAVNYFYDVPVKIVSTALVLLCLFLLLPNFNRLIMFFFKGQAVALRNLAMPAIKKRWMYYTLYSIKYLFIVFMVSATLFSLMKSRKLYGDAAPRSPIYGAYKVNTFVLKKDTLDVSAPDEYKWTQLLIESPDFAFIRYKNEHSEQVNLKTDTARKKITLYFDKDSTNVHHFDYQLLKAKDLTLKGTLFGDSVTIALTKMDFELTGRKFNWVNEYPYNR